MKARVSPRASGSTTQLAAVSTSFGCDPPVRLPCRKELESRMASITFAPRIQTAGLTPFRPDQQVLTLDDQVRQRLVVGDVLIMHACRCEFLA